jgi:hypothetical protein
MAAEDAIPAMVLRKGTNSQYLLLEEEVIRLVELLGLKTWRDLGLLVRDQVLLGLLERLLLRLKKEALSREGLAATNGRENKFFFS